MSLEDQVPDAVFKVIVIGDSAVGKSCFTLQFIDGRFKEDHAATIGVEYWSKMLEADGRIVKLQVWDTVLTTQAGQESFRAITRTFYRNVNAVLLMYDLTREETFESLEGWLKEVRANSDPDVCIYLVGNMSDLAEDEREVPTEKAERFGRDHNLQGFIEASAKSDVNVDVCGIDRVFKKIAKILYDRMAERETKEQEVVPSPVVIHHSDNKKKTKKCC